MTKIITILYENENYLVIDKPAGLIVHSASASPQRDGSDGKTKEETLVDWVVENYPEMENVGEPLELQSGEVIKRSGIVHRLDRETSGCIALAKNQEAYEFLKNQFKNREIKKVYKTFVTGVLKNNEDVIDRPIGRSPKFGLWSATKGMKGKVREAVTEYKVLERGSEHSFLEVKPKTGRTHQIRVHLKAINYPVVCDKIYNPKTDCAFDFERLALHAESLEFKDLGGQKIMVVAPLPEDFANGLKEIKNIAE
jgi:23S rRNA pseudouridine1911/1915/1917 synthase